MTPASDPASLPLRDIHLPEQALWWPPAPGWWILLVIILLLLVLAFFLIRKHKARKHSAVSLARIELQQIESRYAETADRIGLVRDLSALLRRLSISLFPRTDAAALVADEWLSFLDRLMTDEPFQEGVGRALVDAPYQANPDFDSGELLELIGQWIGHAGQYKGSCQ